MEQQLSESQWSPTEATQQLSCLQHTMVEKERDINRLECQVDEQRLMRINDAKQVEAKAAKIKEWVTNKLREVRNLYSASFFLAFVFNRVDLLLSYLFLRISMACVTR